MSDAGGNEAKQRTGVCFAGEGVYGGTVSLAGIWGPVFWRESREATVDLGWWQERKITKKRLNLV
jgi:hypothetical protein